MITRVEFDENATLWYGNDKILIRTYEYDHKNPINDLVLANIKIEIYFNGENDKFAVKSIIEDATEFDTFRDANTYALKKIHEYYNKSCEMIEMIRKVNNKRKQVKNNE